MGLDALVYRNRSAIRQMIGDREVDGVTGEPLLDETKNEPELMAKCISMERRLGNAASVGEIHWILTEWGRLNEDGILMNRILSSASHAGDFIPFNDLHGLLSELLEVKSSHLYTHNLIKEFVDEMSALCFAAQKEKNPIVFV